MTASRYFVLLLTYFLFIATAAHGEHSKNVLVLHMENSHTPANVAASRAIQEVLGRDPTVQIFEEYLDEDRLGVDGAAMADVFARKYTGQRFALIMTVGPPALRFLAQYGEQLWPSVPRVFADVDGSPEQLPPNTTGVYGFFRFAPTLDLALQLQPDVQHVFYIGGGASGEIARRSIAQNEFRPYMGRLDFTYINGLPLPQLLNRLSGLPPHSVVIYTTFFKDNEGNTFVTANLAPVIVAASNAPVYGTLQGVLGSGIVGGSLFDFGPQTHAAAELGLKILRGTPATSLAVEEGPSNKVVVDWRQLKRWSIPETNVPTNATIMFRELTLWERYRDYVWIAAGVLIGQTLLLMVLFIQVRARQRSNVAIRGLTMRLVHATEDERKRVASELHDDIGQRLSLLSAQLDSMVIRSGNEIESQELKECLHEVDALVTDVHDLSHQLHSSQVQHLGLDVALRNLCRSIAQRNNLNIAVECADLPSELRPDVSVCLYRIAQEALNNIVRHSGSDRVEISVSGTEGRVTMIVKDFGHGFEAAKSPAGLGLVTMEERLKAISGTFSVSSKLGVGTTISASLPLREAVAGHETAETQRGSAA
ncbi:ATP-binding protein [Terriglobus sp. TAA 43]|uniref:sensor histidine kinase n=1 Tax=Terriglobus sp. TAA 43 TaxID=278961 RepID=UPI000646AAAC|nr:ATP-binding protein [Terriglobus sp. TAA 43]